MIFMVHLMMIIKLTTKMMKIIKIMKNIKIVQRNILSIHISLIVVHHYHLKLMKIMIPHHYDNFITMLYIFENDEKMQENKLQQYKQENERFDIQKDKIKRQQEHKMFYLKREQGLKEEIA
eukprot:UN08536